MTAILLSGLNLEYKLQAVTGGYTCHTPSPELKAIAVQNYSYDY